VKALNIMNQNALVTWPMTAQSLSV